MSKTIKESNDIIPVNLEFQKEAIEMFTIGFDASAPEVLDNLINRMTFSNDLGTGKFSFAITKPINAKELIDIIVKSANIQEPE